MREPLAIRARVATRHTINRRGARDRQSEVDALRRRLEQVESLLAQLLRLGVTPRERAA